MCDLLVLGVPDRRDPRRHVHVRPRGQRAAATAWSASTRATTRSRTIRTSPKHRQDPAINTYHIEQFAYLLGKLKSVKEGDGTLLDNCMIAYGSAIADGNRHNHDDLPVLLAGSGGGTIKTGRHVRVERETPLNNLWLAMLDRMGAPTKQLGDSTGVLRGWPDQKRRVIRRCAVTSALSGIERPQHVRRGDRLPVVALVVQDRELHRIERLGQVVGQLGQVLERPDKLDRLAPTRCPAVPQSAGRNACQLGSSPKSGPSCARAGDFAVFAGDRLGDWRASRFRILVGLGRDDVRRSRSIGLELAQRRPPLLAHLGHRPAALLRAFEPHFGVVQSGAA